MPSTRTTGLANLALAAAISFVAIHLPGGSESPASSDVAFVEATPKAPPSPRNLASWSATTDPSSVQVLFTGDIMQHGGQQSDNFAASYAQIAPIIQRADLAVGNLEFPVLASAPVGPPAGSVQFNGSVNHLDAIAGAGFDVLSLANNHAFDQGATGLRATFSELQRRSIRPVGAATTIEELDQAALIVPCKEIRIAFFAYTGFLNTYVASNDQFEDPPANLPVAGLNFAEWDAEYRQEGQERFRRDVARARAKGANFVVALPHWGEEWHFQPTDDQRLAGHDMIDNGFDLVVGGHGHVINSPELYHDRLIVYSLGNLISDFRDWRTRTGAILVVTLERRASENVRITNFEFHGIMTMQPGHVVTPTSGIPTSREPDLSLSIELLNRTFGDALTP